MPRKRLSERFGHYVLWTASLPQSLWETTETLGHFRPWEVIEDACGRVVFKREKQEERVQRSIESERVEAHRKNDQTSTQGHMEHVKSSPLMAERDAAADHRVPSKKPRS